MPTQPMENTVTKTSLPLLGLALIRVSGQTPPEKRFFGDLLLAVIEAIADQKLNERFDHPRKLVNVDRSDMKMPADARAVGLGILNTVQEVFTDKFDSLRIRSGAPRFIPLVQPFDSTKDRLVVRRGQSGFNIETQL